MVRISRAAAALPFALVMLVILVGCGSSSSSSSSTSSAQAGGASGGAASQASVPASCRQPGVITDKVWNSGAKQLPAPKNPASLKGKQIAFIGFGQNNVWSQWVFKGVKCEAEEWGAQAVFIGPPKFDPQAQFQEASDLATNKNYAALVAVPNDSTSLAPALKQVAAASIPTVSMLQPAGPNVLSMTNQVPGLTGNVIEDLTVNAQAMAGGVIDACGNTNPCNVIVIWGARTLAFDKVKPKIFDAQIASHPKIKIVCQADGGYDQGVGRTVTADCLQAHPNVNVLASQADQQTRGSERALQAAGKSFGLGPNDVKIVSAYGTAYGISQVRAGKWFQTSYNRAQDIGMASTRLALLKLAGNPAPVNLSFLVQDRDFDKVPNRLTRPVLQQHPDVIGQWNG